MRTALNRSQQNKHRQKEQNAETEDAAVNRRRNRPGRTTQEWRAGAPQVAECGGMARTVAGWVVGLAHGVVWGCGLHAHVYESHICTHHTHSAVVTSWHLSMLVCFERVHCNVYQASACVATAHVPQ